jgi:anti-sigma-K factor RskA
MTQHDHYDDAIAPYLLQALPDDERQDFESHLLACADCRSEVARLQVAVDVLPASVPQYEAPPELRDRIMSVVRREAELLAAAGPEADRPPAPVPEKRSWNFRMPRMPRLAVGGTLAGAVAGVALGAVLLSDGPMTRTVPAEVGIQGAQASLVIHDDDSKLVAENLPAPAAGRVYQVWVKRPGRDPEATDALFTVRSDGSAVVSVPGSMDGVEAVLVTSEPEGGSLAPTRKPIISAVPS